jgi:hypothetical protein
MSCKITEIENMLAITREIKALWIKGPIRKPGEDRKQEEELDAKAEMVQDMYNQVMALRAANAQKNAEAMLKATSTTTGGRDKVENDVAPAQAA